MAENPLIHVPKAWPTIHKLNSIRRKVVGQARSFDVINWEDTSYGKAHHHHMDIHESVVIGDNVQIHCDTIKIDEFLLPSLFM